MALCLWKSPETVMLRGILTIKNRLIPLMTVSSDAHMFLREKGNEKDHKGEVLNSFL